MSYRKALTERLIQILFKLVRRPHSRQELAREFAVNAKTIKRDLDVLSQEFPITEEKRGREIFYSYADGYKFKTPSLSFEEIATLLLAKKAIEGIGITAGDSFYAKQADSALEKIKKSLPAVVAAKLAALAEVYGSSQIPEKDFSRHIETIDRLASCAVRCRKVQIRYHSLNKNENALRILHPLAVYFDPDGATLKLIAFDPKYDRESVFSVDRILSITELKDKFQRPKNFTLKNFLDDNCFNGIFGSPETIRLKAFGITARIFAERKFHPTQKIIERKQSRGASPETITIEMRVASGRGLHRFILSYLPEIKVVAPLSLRQEINDILRKSLPGEEIKKFTVKT
ncbi:MAG: WYL domain-containing protein [Acidobacteriota bacterium]